VGEVVQLGTNKG